MGFWATRLETCSHYWWHSRNYNFFIIKRVGYIVKRWELYKFSMLTQSQYGSLVLRSHRCPLVYGAWRTVVLLRPPRLPGLAMPKVFKHQHNKSKQNNIVNDNADKGRTRIKRGKKGMKYTWVIDILPSGNPD